MADSCASVPATARSGHIIHMAKNSPLTQPGAGQGHVDLQLITRRKSPRHSASALAMASVN
jgi:hypothetical protein